MGLAGKEDKKIGGADMAENISVTDFQKLNSKEVTILDVREQAEVLVFPVNDSINIPFSQLTKRFKEIPAGKPVYVICSTGDLSEQVVEILEDRDFEAHNVEGGVKALKEAVKSQPLFIDAKGLKCPGPIVKVADTIKNLPVGASVYVEATEDAFYSDVAVWCDRTGNQLKEIKIEEGVIKASIVKGLEKKEEAGSFEHGKTFVVFSGDLDKALASFIMANGAAAMGRKVTLFFTFWGLNILRKNERVKVKKGLIGKMFGMMMPRGSKKLGLSKMNMGGAGAKMIRAVMKANGISSLEELIQNAVNHGVRLVACQMSMDIMGIKKEELIDGVELGGVATMLGSAEKSDLTYFI